MNSEWAIGEMDTFLAQTTTRLVTNENSVRQIPMAPNDDITRQAIVIERILDRATPGWRSSLRKLRHLENRWAPLRESVLRGREVLNRAVELKANLGENAPELSASEFHPWIWDGASSLWQSGHFREAVEGAIKKLNAETQNKLGRHDASEIDLFKQAFSLDVPHPGKPRLRRMKDDGSKTYKNMHLGAMSFADGIFTAIRNPASHEADLDFSEQEALEYLAALSVLARWLDDATVERMETTP